MSPSQHHTVQDASDDSSVLFLAHWLQIMHTSAAAVDEARDACAAGDDAEPTDEEFLASGHRSYLTAVLPPFTRLRTANTCEDCGGQRWLFPMNVGCLSECRVLLTGHNPGCAWFADFIARALAEGALDLNGDFVPEAERTA